MASFAQNQPIQFTPYIPKVDVSTYAQVGQFKQGRYDAGVQQAQSYIDSVAGLSVGPEVDKQYLQQKLKDVTSKANQLAGSDFSDQKIVGQIGSIAAGVANDGIIQNAVASTLRYKKQLSDLEEAKKAGKSGAANEWDFQRQAGEWMNSTTPGQSFNGTFSPYRDVRKKALDVIKDLTKDSSITDDAFTIDSSGSVVLSDAVVRTKLGGLSPQRIKAAIASSLDSEDMHQLSIEGDYSFSNQTPEQFAQSVSQAHKADIDDLQGKRKTILAKAEGIADGQEKNKLLSQVADLDKEIGSVAQDNQSYMDMIGKGNIRQARANYYTTNFLRNFSNSFSYRDVSQTYENNPMAQIQLERTKMAQAASQFQQKFEQENQQFSLTYDQKERHHKTETDIATGAYGKVNLTIPQNQLPDISLDNFKNQTDSLQNALNTREADFLTTQGHKDDKEWINTQRLQYEKSPTSVTPSIKDYFDHRIQEEKTLQTNQQLITQLGKEVDQKVGTLKTVIPANAEHIQFTLGRQLYDFRPEEIVNFNNKLKQIQASSESQKGTLISTLIGTPSDAASFNNDLANQILTPKEKKLFDLRQKQLQGASLNPTETLVANTLNKYDATINRDYVNLIENRQKFLNKELADRTGESQRASFEVPTGKAEQKASVKGMVQSFIDRSRDMKTSMGDGVNVDTLNEFNNEDKATYRVITKGQTQYGSPRYWISVSTEKGTQQFEISEKDKQDVLGNRYENTVQDAFSPIRQRLDMTTNGSTNFNGTSDPIKAAANAYLYHTDFGNVKNFSVKGDIYKQNGKYGLALYVLNPITKQQQKLEYAPPSGLMDEKQVMQSISMIDDAAIFELMTGQKLTPEVLQQIQQENKKAH